MIRVAVIGTGSMGRNHVRVYRELPQAELIGIADPDPETASRVAQHFGVAAYTDHIRLLNETRPVAVSVAVPTQEHHRIVMDCLERGVHVLVEKPIAASVVEGAELVGAARSRGLVLMVGHIERFNPAIIEMKKRLVDGQLGRVFQLHARRLGPFPARIRDVGVVVDLATHDLDIMRYLTGSEASRIFAETSREIHTSNEDLVSGLVRFANDAVGVLEINWLTPTKIREITVTGERGMFRADYLLQDLYFFENSRATDGGWSPLNHLRGGVDEGSMTRYAVRRHEPLAGELGSFLAAVCGEEASIVSGEDGLAALRLALALIESANARQAVHV